MFRRILVALTGFESDGPTLDTAYLTGRLFGAHLDCICARPGPAQIAIGASPFEIGAAMNAAELIADLQKENELRTKNARLSFEAFSKARRVPAADGLSAHDGDLERARKLYEGMTPLSAEDIAEAIAWVATRPPHVDIDEMVIRPRDQATATLVHRRTS